jgi:hypothetical protein
MLRYLKSDEENKSLGDNGLIQITDNPYFQ